MHRTLERLDRLARHLSDDPGVLAVLGLGSAGAESHRFDNHSDIDFFVIVQDDKVKRRYLDGIEWLAGFGGNVVYDYVNDPNGRKALFGDGLFLEYAIFTPEQLAAIPLHSSRVVWSRPGFAHRDRLPVPGASLDTVDFHLNEALTNLYVGLRRELRGERLAAMRFIQVYAVDQALALQRLDPKARWPQRDPFDPTRRAEQVVTREPMPLAGMVLGYERNAESAGVTLEWLTRSYRPSNVIVSVVQGLVDKAR